MHKQVAILLLISSFSLFAKAENSIADASLSVGFSIENMDPSFEAEVVQRKFLDEVKNKGVVVGFVNPVSDLIAFKLSEGDFESADSLVNSLAQLSNQYARYGAARAIQMNKLKDQKDNNPFKKNWDIMAASEGDSCVGRCIDDVISGAAGGAVIGGALGGVRCATSKQCDDKDKGKFVNPYFNNNLDFDRPVFAPNSGRGYSSTPIPRWVVEN